MIASVRYIQTLKSKAERLAGLPRSPWKSVNLARKARLAKLTSTIETSLLQVEQTKAFQPEGNGFASLQFHLSLVGLIPFRPKVRRSAERLLSFLESYKPAPCSISFGDSLAKTTGKGETAKHRHYSILAKLIESTGAAYLRRHYQTQLEQLELGDLQPQPAKQYPRPSYTVVPFPNLPILKTFKPRPPTELEMIQAEIEQRSILEQQEAIARVKAGVENPADFTTVRKILRKRDQTRKRVAAHRKRYDVESKALARNQRTLALLQATR